MNTMHRAQYPTVAATLLLVLSGCADNTPPPQFDTATVTRRDIIVTVQAAGIVEPLLTVDIRSKASGEVLKTQGETGEVVKAGTLLVQIDKRNPRNLLAQAEAELEAALARRAIAKAQNERSRTLFATRTINEVDFEKTQLEYANARADVVRAQVAVETARITLDDTDVRAPIDGTIIEKLVESGQVISSPMRDFGGGTPLLKMADLTTMQVRALVDETEVGKISPGKPVLVRVTAYPNQPFPGEVHKIEPQAKVDQSVTTFAVLIRLPNPERLLRPGMNADVEIGVAERRDVLTVPAAALRMPREIPIAAAALGLDPDSVREQLGADTGATAPAEDSSGGYQYAGRYWVFVERNGGAVAVNVETGITDLEHNEVISGLGEGDKVVLMPSTGVLEAQERGREWMKRFSVVPGTGRQSGSTEKRAGGSR
jgi:HlyD family secretion protein